jgi:hypothetical protein
LEVLASLRSQGLSRAALAVVLRESIDVRLTVAKTTGAIHLVVGWPGGYHEKLKGPLEALLGL